MTGPEPQDSLKKLAQKRKGLTTDQQLSVDRGETPKGKYSIMDALDALAKRRQVLTPDTPRKAPNASR